MVIAQVRSLTTNVEVRLDAFEVELQQVAVEAEFVTRVRQSVRTRSTRRSGLLLRRHTRFDSDTPRCRWAFVPSVGGGG